MFRILYHKFFFKNRVDISFKNSRNGTYRGKARMFQGFTLTLKFSFLTTQRAMFSLNT